MYSNNGSKEVQLSLSGKGFSVAKLSSISNINVILDEDVNDMFESRERYTKNGMHQSRPSVDPAGRFGHPKRRK